MSTLFQIRQCTNLSCLFRFPQVVSDSLLEVCPSCGETTTLVQQYSSYSPPVQVSALDLFNTGDQASKEVMAAQSQSQSILGDATSLPIELLLDNLRSVFNVGTIFRTADGAGVSHIHLCGITATPTNPRMAKTALGAESTITWGYDTNGLRRAEQLLEMGKTLWALEITPESQSLYELPKLAQVPPTSQPAPLVLMVGNEVSGIDPAILALAAKQVHLPMMGIKGSLNVAVALGVALYHIRFHHQLS